MGYNYSHFKDEEVSHKVNTLSMVSQSGSVKVGPRWSGSSLPVYDDSYCALLLPTLPFKEVFSFSCSLPEASLPRSNHCVLFLENTFGIILCKY
jgi:hypothetical protein